MPEAFHSCTAESEMAWADRADSMEGAQSTAEPAQSRVSEPAGSKGVRELRVRTGTSTLASAPDAVVVGSMGGGSEGVGSMSTEATSSPTRI